jgi:hypothetical protein
VLASRSARCSAHPPLPTLIHAAVEPA